MQARWGVSDDVPVRTYQLSPRSAWSHRCDNRILSKTGRHKAQDVADTGTSCSGCRYARGAFGFYDWVLELYLNHDAGWRL